MLHYAHHAPNHLPQPRTSPRHPHPHPPQAPLEPTAFARQLDEIDHLLHAFRLQRQRQSAYTWMPADEDTDEKLLNSESDGESGRRWSESTESKDARGGGGGGEVSDAGSLLKGDGADLLAGNPAGQVGDEGLGFGLVFSGFGPPLDGLASVLEEGGLREEPRLLGRAVGEGSRLGVEARFQPIVSQGNDGGSFASGVDSDLDELNSAEDSGLKTAVEKNELAPVRRVTFILPMANEEDNGRDDEDTPEWTSNGCRVDT